MPTRSSRIHKGLTACVLALALVGVPAIADAFCGFYVAGADASLYNDATVVVLMRDGTRTVLAMQNDYQGPPEDFALVVPVPVVLRKGDVKTLPKSLFERVDKLAAPRLVEYFERDPCHEPPKEFKEEKKDDSRERRPAPERGVRVEAEFEVGEYQVQVLSAQDASGLDTWLREHDYRIPAGAEPLLRPYVQSGMKFFVAKVDVSKVQFEGGRAMLSPLRFHYDSPEFSLPVRLGLINARGPQDLLIHVLATDRYQVANRPTVTIPTNLVVREHTKDAFGPFYVALFDKTLADTPGAVVTEYAWQANNCDPCPEEPLTFDELRMLGADVLPRYAKSFDEQGNPHDPELRFTMPARFVLTRLHARYDAQSLAEDLVFATAPPIVGGRGMPDSEGKLDPAVHESSGNQFQARYAILHPWTGSSWCLDPEPGEWGTGRGGRMRSATNLAFESRDAKLEEFVSADAHLALGLPGQPLEPKKSCNCTSEPDAGGPTSLGLALLALAYLHRRRNHA